ncbi:MAG: hypothetical protein K2N03_08370 [Muribaculaceae bacterium]|nr:hypothetical protein [Muribaculaceae bacterium]
MEERIKIDEDMETVKGRLRKFLKHKGITQYEFTKLMGVSQSYVATLRRSMPADKIMKIREIFPDLNHDWLLYGEGEMLVETSSGRDNPERREYEVPLLPVSAFAGNLQLWSEGVREIDCTRVVSPVKDADFAIPICGDSMEPDFQDGATILIKRINERAFIPWGNAMVIDTENGVLLKDLYPDERDNESLIARSRNEKYPPIRIPKSSVYGIYRVLCALKMYPTM